MPKNSSKVVTNLETLAKDIGSYLGMAEGIQQKDYMHGMIRSAHGKTVPDFVAAAAKGAKAGNFTHMYEYGVAGITRGDKRFINPLLPSARLWNDIIIGTGGQQKITFTYRPAKNRVPKHTTESTGVAQEELDELAINKGKRYVFYNRAQVFEQGIDLNIFPKKSGGMLFVPLRGTPGVRASEKDEERGFTWAKSVHINPGAATDSIGAFQFFFYNWWETEGGARMATYMDKEVTKDIEATEAQIAATRGGMKTPATTNINGTADMAKKKVRKQFTIWAQREEGMWEVIV